MKTVVVTGPICSGKSTLSGLLAARGGVVVDADQLGHQLLLEPGIGNELVSALGPDILKDGQIERKLLGNLVFRSPVAMATLNRIIHPVLAARIDRVLADLAGNGHHALAVLEAAVYFLLPIQWPIDLVVAVQAPRELRQGRLEERNGLEPGVAQDRIRAQNPLEQDWAQAELLVQNDGGPEVLELAVVDILTRVGLADFGSNSAASIL